MVTSSSSDDHSPNIKISGGIRSKFLDEISNMLEAQILFHCTCMYDRNMFQAVSKIVQKAIPQLSGLE